MPRQPSDSITRLNSMHMLSSINVADLNARITIPSIAATARRDVRAVETEAQIPHRARVRSQSVRAVPVGSIPQRDHAVAATYSHVRARGRVLDRIGGARVGTESVEAFQTGPIEDLDLSLARRSKEFASRVRESHGVELAAVFHR